ncbi:conserved hypothetical protein [Microsporum canis CBS 113480]|uniref:Nuclear pore complex subunit Nup192 n=1 Tax=Arthroderma otae (strain ATCC MYA-4605 / CBS 113480) TaxID=554155 RepID=C5FQW5_ARTOC|nr:conserved hypothetical protein [Microsporum canis CBS 113480]EEQ32268.1 conserved hypothetical protein [Microsporum canis CBS 113480]
MEGDESSDNLRGLYQDLSALSRFALPNAERLVAELEATLQDFRRLLDRPSKNNDSRKTVLSGKIKLADVEYEVNLEFQQEVLQVADALDVDEIEAARYYIRAQSDSKKLDRSPIVSSIIRFHEQREFVLECLRLILHESFEVEREETQLLMKEYVASVLEIQNGPLRNGSLFARKCMDAMTDIEKWLVLLGEQIQKASIVGQSQEADILEVIEYQRQSLGKQHESLGAIIDKFDMLLVHYIPSIIAATSQYGSSEGQGIDDARSLHKVITESKDSQSWVLPQFHAATIVFWLAEYSGWYFDSGAAGPLQGINTADESAKLSKALLAALEDGGFHFILSICAGVGLDEWKNMERNELVTLLLKEGIRLTPEPDDPSPYFHTILMESIEGFTESLIANMPDAIRMLKSEEDTQRLDQITALRDSVSPNLHRGPVEVRMHLECLLTIIAFSFDGRNDAAQEFWLDPDGNLYGFLQWVSKRQTVPRASAFCEMLCSISGGEENSAAAHKFLIDEDSLSSAKFRRSASMNWTQMFAEIHLYAVRITERPSTTQSSTLRLRKLEVPDIEEPESPIMLTSYLRLISHLCRENGKIRDWILQHQTVNLIPMLLTLCGASIPQHLRAAIFVTLRCLMIDRTSAHSNEMWTSLDNCISSSGSLPLALSRLPSLSSPPVRNERHAFQRITESFDQMNTFVEMLNNLVTPVSDALESQLTLPFPESLGSSYRMPGIEPYIDYVMGQAFANRSAMSEDKESHLLQWNCMNFAATCLESFNDNLVSIVSQPSISAQPNWKVTFSTYLRLHPFSRVMEWLFNEDVLRVLFSCSHRDADGVSKASSNSILVSSLVRSIDIMNLILDHQPTYFHIVRPMIKSTGQDSSFNIANSTLACFEDCVIDNLGLISDLCLYCGTGHPQLTLTSLALLEKLSASRKLNKSSNISSRWQSTNQMVEQLNSNVEADRVARSLASQIDVDMRELESGPDSSGYLIKMGLLQLLDKCLKMSPEKPTIAHLLLGFSCLGNTLDISSDSLFENGISLLHSILEFVKSYPLGTDGAIVSWMIHLRRLGFQVLLNLWSSPLSSNLTLPYLRAGQLLPVLLISQPVVTADTLWDDFRTNEPHFWLSSSPSALSELLMLRTLLYEYATTEIRAVYKQSSPSLQRDTLRTILGNTVAEGDQTIEHPSLFDLFDFADIDIDFSYTRPELQFFGNIDVENCVKTQEDGAVVLYDIEALQELLQLVKEDLVADGVVTPQNEEQVIVEKEKLLLFLRATNEFRYVRFNRFIALKAWTELVTIIAVTCKMDPAYLATFIQQTLQLILPKFESSIVGNSAEAIELAHLGETLIDGLDKIPSNTNGDVIDERLDYLFQVCINGIPQTSDNIILRESLYQICSKHLARVTASDSTSGRFKEHAHNAIKVAGPTLMETICDDAYGGSETCRVSALVLLNLLGTLDQQRNSSLLVNLITHSNYLGMFLDVLRMMPSEFRSAKAADTAQLLLFYESQLSLLQQLSQTKAGAAQLLDAGLFQAVKESQLFSADPDIGIDIDNSDALQRYYDLLLSVLQVIVSTVFARGLHNQAICDQTRTFLSENRQSMVGIFKRCAKSGSLDDPNMKKCLENLAKSYTVLIASVDFLDYEDNQSTITSKPKFFS